MSSLKLGMPIETEIGWVEIATNAKEYLLDLERGQGRLFWKDLSLSPRGRGMRSLGERSEPRRSRVSWSRARG
jgi:hypothetical protein